MAAGRRAVVALLVAGLLAAVPAAAARAVTVAGSSTAHRAVGYLQRAQNPDGGLGAAPGEASAQLFAGWAALGLASAGVDVAALRRAPGRPTLLAYVRAGVGAPGDGDVGSLERTILVLRAVGVGADGLAAQLQRRVAGDGAVSGQVNLTAFAVLALRAAGDPATDGARVRATRWLTGQADGDGGYGYAGRGSGSDADDTGAVLEALAGSRAPGVATARLGAVRYLRDDEGRDGGFSDGVGAGSNAQSTAWAIQGLLAAGVAPGSLRRDGHTPLSYLQSLVTSSGAVRYAAGVTQTPVWVTGEALMALTGTPLPVVGRAVVTPRSAAGGSPGTARSAGARRVSRASRRTPVRRSRPAHPRVAAHRVAAPRVRRSAAPHHAGTGAAVGVELGRMETAVGALATRIVGAVRLGD